MSMTLWHSKKNHHPQTPSWIGLESNMFFKPFPPKKKVQKLRAQPFPRDFFGGLMKEFDTSVVFPIDNSLLELSSSASFPFPVWRMRFALGFLRGMGSDGNGVLTLPEKSLAILRFFGWEDCFVVPANQSRKERRPHILLRNGSSSTMKNLVFCFKPKASIGPVYLSVLVDQKNPCHQM